MATTIQVSGETKQLLSMLKEREGGNSYEQILRGLIDLKLKTPKTMFGKLPRVIHMTKEDKKQVSKI